MAERKSSDRNETINRRVRVRENNMYITIYIASVVCATNMERAINTNRNLLSKKFAPLMSPPFRIKVADSAKFSMVWGGSRNNEHLQ